MNLYPFCPAYGSNQLVSAGASAVSVAIAAQNKQVRIINKSENMVYVRTYPSVMGTVAATTADYGVPPCTPESNMQGVIITKDETHDRLSYIAPAGSSAIEIMTGEGF